ncbi:MAG: hypothetical protein CM15mV126_010 [uncultured marine virus]|nr:MAG: hypothetical protein CM15mV126_010 [uncultured marine virus]
MAKTLIDKDVKENIILPHALKTTQNFPPEQGPYDEKKSQGEICYQNAWNVANPNQAHTPKPSNAMREKSERTREKFRFPETNLSA